MHMKAIDEMLMTWTREQVDSAALFGKSAKNWEEQRRRFTTDFEFLVIDGTSFLFIQRG